jgi:hypothetical protein
MGRALRGHGTPGAFLSFPEIKAMRDFDTWKHYLEIYAIHIFKLSITYCGRNRDAECSRHGSYIHGRVS